MPEQQQGVDVSKLSTATLRRIAWQMELGDRALAAMAAEHVHGVAAIVARVGR